MYTIEMLMKESNNYFYRWVESNAFVINDNKIKTLKGNYLVNQYIKIMGSILNDGIYKVEAFANNELTITGLQNEEFDGHIFGLAIPKEFIELSATIEKYVTSAKSQGANKVSESFNNYSVSYATGDKGKPLQWMDIYKEDIDNYRQLYSGERRVKQI